MRALLTILTSSLALCGLANCGGGGGSDDGSFAGAGKVELSASPREIDPGDRTLVIARIRDVHPDGISVKFRYPSGLVYVRNSATFLKDESESDLAPKNVVTDDNDSYIVFYIEKSKIRDDEEGAISIELEGEEEVRLGAIAVDIDVDDPDISNDNEFTVENPQFEPTESVDITVR